MPLIHSLVCSCRCEKSAKSSPVMLGKKEKPLSSLWNTSQMPVCEDSCGMMDSKNKNKNHSYSNNSYS